MPGKFGSDGKMYNRVRVLPCFYKKRQSLPPGHAHILKYSTKLFTTFDPHLLYIDPTKFQVDR